MTMYLDPVDVTFQTEDGPGRIPLSTEHYHELLDGRSAGNTIQIDPESGQPVLVKIVYPSAAEAAKKELNADFTAAMADLQKPWPDAEAQTWTFQAEEARQWIAAPANAKPATPFLSSLHAQREALGWEGTLEDLVKRVIHNTTVYTAATASLIGRRHVAEAAIEAAEDPASVTWDFNLAEPAEG